MPAAVPALKITEIWTFLKRPLLRKEPAGFPLSERLALILLAGFFLFLNVVFPGLPGMTNEGLLKSQYAAGVFLDLLRENSFWELFRAGRLPAGIEGYQGVVAAYPFLPFLVAFGRNWPVMHYWPLIFDVFTLLFAYLLMKQLAGRRTALLGLALLLIHPTYAMGVRIGGAMVNHMLFYSTGALYFFTRWAFTRRVAWLGAGMIFLGIGISTHIWFFWLLPALALAALAFRAPLQERLDLRPGRRLFRAAAVAVLCFLAGGVVFIYREFVAQTSSYETLAGQFLRPGLEPGFASRLERFWNNALFLHFFLSGDYFFDRIFANARGYVVDPAGNRLFPWVAYGSALFLLTRAARERFGRRIRLLPIVFLTIAFEACLTPHKTPHMHFFFLYPLPPLIAAAAFSALWDRAAGKKAARLALAGLLAIFAAKEVHFLGRYLKQLGTTGGERLFSESIHDLADWVRLRHRPGEPLFVFSDGDEIQRHLYFMVPERDLRFVYVEGDSPGETAEDLRKKIEKQGGTGILVRWTASGWPSAYYRMDAFGEAAGLRLTPLADFRDWDETPVFEVYRVRTEKD